MAYAEILSALADPTRRGIYEELTAAPRTVGDLARERPISRPAVSQHLKVLEAAGLVSVTPQGTARVYRAVPAGLAPLRAYVEDLWSDALQSYAREVIRQGGGSEGGEPDADAAQSGNGPAPVSGSSDA